MNTMSSSSDSSNASSSSSDEVVSDTMRHGLETIIVRTGAGILMGGLAGIVLARGGGGSGARKALAGLGGGIGLGSAWTRTSMDLEELLSDDSPKK